MKRPFAMIALAALLVACAWLGPDKPAIGFCRVAAAQADVRDDQPSTPPRYRLVERGTPASLRVLELAVEVDREFLARFELDQADEVLELAGENFARELSISLKLVSLTQEEGFSSRTTEPVVLLGEFRERWRKDRREVVCDAAHLLTGRQLDGGLGGVAYVGAVCDARWSFGLSYAYDSRETTARILAHELAHALGAGHDERDSPYLMAPFLGRDTISKFSAGTRFAVATYVAGTACLDAWSRPPRMVVGNGPALGEFDYPFPWITLR